MLKKSTIHMEDLEKYVNENLDQFNDTEPDPGHFEKFRQKLELQSGKNLIPARHGMMLKIAAAILILLTVSMFIFDHSLHGLKSMLRSQTASVVFPADVNDAMQYYSQQASRGMNQINQLAGSGQQGRQLTDMALNDIRSLDANTDR